MRHPIALCLLLAGATLSPLALAAEQSVSGEASWASPKSAVDFALRDPGYPAASIEWLQLAPPELAEVAALKRANSGGSKRLQVGLERAVHSSGNPFVPALNWMASPDGGLTARFAVESAGAEAVRLAIVARNLPALAELRVSAADGLEAATDASSGAEINARLRAEGAYWTPLTIGASQQVEIHLPAGVAPEWVRVEVDRIAHLLVSPLGAIDMSKIGESDSCESDAICVSNPSTAFNNAKNSVARMLFQDGGTFVCTGTLLNDTDSSTQFAWLYSAAHCISTQAAASTLVTYWFYEASTCGGSTLSSASRQVSGGAQLSYADDSSDVLLLKLNGTPPAGSYYLGWTSATLTAGTSIHVIHHPAGDVKKYSVGKVKTLGPSNLASGSFIQAGYTQGTTEGGSSGSGLLSLGSEYQLRGGLLGGAAGCSNTGNLNNASNSDDYSRFDLAFDELRSFLSPSSTPPVDTNDYSGAWFNPAQSGWGVNVVKGSSGAYGIFIYHYDSSNRPIWYLSAGPLTGSTFNQPVLKFSGPWFGVTPFNPAQVSSASVGTLTVNFASTSSATVNFTIDGRSVSTSISKLDF